MAGNSQKFARIKLGIKLISDSVKKNQNIVVLLILSKKPKNRCIKISGVSLGSDSFLLSKKK